MRFVVEQFHRDVSEKDLIDDLKSAAILAVESDTSLTYRNYSDYGTYSGSTIAARFGSWNEGLAAAGISCNETRDVEDKQLFLSLEAVWIQLGRQPKTRDLVRPVSRFSHELYRKRFGGYRQALNEFVKWTNTDDLFGDALSAPQIL